MKKANKRWASDALLPPASDVYSFSGNYDYNEDLRQLSAYTSIVFTSNRMPGAVVAKLPTELPKPLSDVMVYNAGFISDGGTYGTTGHVYIHPNGDIEVALAPWPNNARYFSVDIQMIHLSVGNWTF